jgi:predicted  nucleic acid-binding Zn-ribbon protein
MVRTTVAECGGALNVFTGRLRARAVGMTEVENLFVDHVNHMRSAIDGLREDMREVKTRLGILESQYASMSIRLDRLDARVKRIERRLDLADA